MLTGWIWYESHSCRGFVGDFTQCKVVFPLMNVRKDSCNSLPVHFLDFLKVISGSNADDAGQLLEFAFVPILSSHAKTACVKLGLYFCPSRRSSWKSLRFSLFSLSKIFSQDRIILRTEDDVFYLRCKNDGRSGSLLPFFKIFGVLRRTKSLFM